MTFAEYEWCAVLALPEWERPGSSDETCDNFMWKMPVVKRAMWFQIDLYTCVGLAIWWQKYSWLSITTLTCNNVPRFVNKWEEQRSTITSGNSMMKEKCVSYRQRAKTEAFYISWWLEGIFRAKLSKLFYPHKPQVKVWHHWVLDFIHRKVQSV